MRHLMGFCQFFLIFTLLSTAIGAEQVSRIVVEVETADELFAGTDNAIFLNFAGTERRLDRPGIDDFERGDTNVFEIDVSAQPLDFAFIRQIREFSLRKPEDDFFGGAWRLHRIEIRVEFIEPYLEAPNEPIFERSGIDVELDSSRRSWTVRSDDTGWNIPPSPPRWPPCRTQGIEPGESSELDADCDGVPDGEDDSFDQPTDSDGDGLPDSYEDQTGTDKGTVDFDRDGWADWNNKAHALVLRELECSGNARSPDLAYIVAEDVRYPHNKDLNGNWRMVTDRFQSINLIVDQRFLGLADDVTERQYKTRVSFGEYQNSTDWAHFEDLPPVEWPQAGLIEVATTGADCDYLLRFQSISLSPFGDPTPNNRDGDTDLDGVNEWMEYKVATQTSEVQPNPIAGYQGLASPIQKEMFVEFDHIGRDNKIPRRTVEDVASRFAYNRVSPRFDQGYLSGGGLATPNQSDVSLSEVRNVYKVDRNNFACERRNHFQYLVGVEKSETFIKNGASDRPGTSTLVVRTTRIQDLGPIVTLHELGHSLDLCHLEGGTEKPFTYPTCDADGGIPDEGLSDTSTYCANYCGVPNDHWTAMGDTSDWKFIALVAAIGAALGLAAGLLTLELIVILVGAGAAVGAVVAGLVVVGAIVGGLIGFGFSEPGQRKMDFHPNEWTFILNGTTDSQTSGLQNRQDAGITIGNQFRFGAGPPEC